MKKPFIGINVIELNNISNVYLMVMKKVKETYGSDFLDCEIQMLSKLSTAVKNHVYKENSKKDNFQKLYKKN